MPRIEVRDLAVDQAEDAEPCLVRFKTRDSDPPDVTLINLNLMLVNQNGRFDQQNYIPLGLLYIASYLEGKGYNVELIDYQLFSHARSFDAALFVETIPEPARLVGFSTMSNLLPFTILCARELKSRHPDCTVVLGGVGPSPVYREIAEAFPFIDSVVEGEGELPMLDLMRGNLVRLSPRRIIRDLDTLPLPAYSLLDFELYDAAPSIITSRGCPYRCTFCTEPHNFGGVVRFRSIESVIEEIKLLHSLSGREMFLFQDDILPLEHSRFRALMKALRDLPFSIEWKCFSRVDLIDENLMREMAESGCVQVRYGIESGSNTTLKRIRKGFTIEEAYEVVKKSVRHFPSVHAAFMWGFPFEDVTEFEATLDWVSRFEEADVTVLLFDFSPLPGCEIYKEFSSRLRFSRDHYPFYVVTGHEVVKPDGLHVNLGLGPVYELIERYPNIFSGFYHYDNVTTLKKARGLGCYQTTRRTPVRSKYDL